MKKSFYLYALSNAIPLALLLACNTSDLKDGLHYTVVNRQDLADDTHQLRSFDESYFGIPNYVDSIKAKRFREILNDTTFHSNSDLGTCFVNGCFLEVKEGEIVQQVYLTCNGVQLMVYTGNEFERTVLLDKKGLEALDALLKNFE